MHSNKRLAAKQALKTERTKKAAEKQRKEGKKAVPYTQNHSKAVG